MYKEVIFKKDIIRTKLQKNAIFIGGILVFMWSVGPLVVGPKSYGYGVEAVKFCWLNSGMFISANARTDRFPPAICARLPLGVYSRSRALGLFLVHFPGKLSKPLIPEA